MLGHRKLKIVVSAVIIVISLFLLQRLLMPKYMTDIVEGALIEEYYQEEIPHDVIFIGDCEVYENFSPATLWKEYGISSYIRGSAQQLVWQSYYILEDTLKYEKPKAVVFNVLAMKYDEPQKEAYNRMTLDGMRWSSSKVKAIQESMTEEEKFIDYIFPILRYHSRWSELKVEDIQYFLKKKKISFNGYYMRTDIKPAENVPEGRKLADYSFGKNAYDYLDRITALCKDNDIELILIKAPSLYPYWYKEWEEQIEEYAEKNHLLYINFLELTEQTGVDFQTDTYDGGLHMNASGAEKLSKYIGEVLQKECNIPDRRAEEQFRKEWDEKVKEYEREKIRRQEAQE